MLRRPKNGEQFFVLFFTNGCFCLYKQEGNNFHSKDTKCCRGKAECGQIGVDERKKARICETWGDIKKTEAKQPRQRQCCGVRVCMEVWGVIVLICFTCCTPSAPH